jgi:phenylpropionate dioxygenase-like ring-hydroxylating dioxygenase large terminal subunit
MNSVETDARLERCIAPPAEAFCIPPECYSNDELLAREIEMIFRRKWVSIGHAGRFAAAGDFEALDIGGVPVIVLRDQSGGLRAYANSCRHRGARLLSGEGNCRGIRCPFHSWAYKLDGSLAAAPNMDDAVLFDRSHYGLVEFRAAELNGLAFVCLDRDAPGLEIQLADFAKVHAPWPMDTLVPVRRRSFDVECNWKTFLDVFNEYYHLPFVHADSINSVYAPPEPATDVSGAFASQYGATEGTGGLLEGEQDHALPAMPGLDPSVSSGVRYTWVFPNMAFAAGADAMWMYETHPIDARRCHVVQTTCFPRQMIARDGFEERARHYLERMDAAIGEDIPALENQQLGLNSPFAQQGRFQPLLEANVAAFANWYARQMLGAQ